MVDDKHTFFLVDNAHIYICNYGAPGFRKGWGGVGHVKVMFMVR